MTKEQIEIMIESLEELNEELSIQNKGSLCFEQWELLDYLKKLDLKCGECDCKPKYPNIGCDTLKDCKEVFCECKEPHHNGYEGETDCSNCGLDLGWY